MRRKKFCLLSWLVLMFLLLTLAGPPGLAAPGAVMSGDDQGPAVAPGDVAGLVVAGDAAVAGEVYAVPALPAAGKGGGPRIIVRYREGVTSGQAALGMGRTLTRAAVGHGAASMDLVELDAGLDLEQALKDLRARPDVLYAEPNYPVKAFQTPDPLYGEQWGLEDPSVVGNTYGIAAAPAWAALTAAGGSKRQAMVGVVDTGVDKDHLDLAGRLAPGYNAITDISDGQAWDDDNGHGTNVAGIIAAAYDNSTGIAGVAGPANVQVLPVRALDSQGSGSVFDVARGIHWAADHGAMVINLSLGTNYYSQTLDEAVQYALDRGVLVVAAAGNEEGPVDKVYPASLPGVLAVAASKSNGGIASFSNYGPGIDLAAPGVDILSTYPMELDTEDGNPDGYTELDGTSMAAPFVAGLAGLLLAADAGLTAGGVQALLEDTAVDLGAPGRDDTFGYGLVNAAAAMNKALGNGVPQQGFSVTITSPAPGVNIVGTTTITATVSDPGKTVAVDFYLDSAITGTLIKTLTQTVYGTYSFDWTPAADNPAVAGGQHTLYAVAKDTTGNTLGQASVTVQIIQEIKTGLALHVLAPDAGQGASPAGSAEVYVFAIERTGAGVNYNEVFNGVTDLQGDLRLPSTTVPDGHEYLVTVNGMVYGSGATEGQSSWFFYHRIFDTAKASDHGRQVIDGGGSVKIDPAVKVGESPINLSSGRILVQPQGMLTGDQPLTALGAAWQASDGPAAFWVDPGGYNFILAGEDSQAGYYLQTGAVQAAGDNLPLTFTATTPMTVTVAHSAGSTVAKLAGSIEPASAMYLVVPSERDVEQYTFDLNGRNLYITPEAYQANFEVILTEGTDTWEYTFERGDPWQVTAQTTTLTLGQGLTQGLTGVAFPDPDNEYTPGGSFLFLPRLQDAGGFFCGRIRKNDAGVDLVNPQLIDANNGPVAGGLNITFAGQDPFGSHLIVNGTFGASLAAGSYFFTVDIPAGPLGTAGGGTVTARSDSFAISANPPGPQEGLPLHVKATAPAGEDWAGGTDTRLRFYERDSQGQFQPVYDATTSSHTSGQPDDFTSAAVYLDAAKSYYAVLTGTCSPDGGVTKNVVVYARSVTVAETVYLGANDTTRPARLRFFARDGGEWNGGSANLDLLIIREGQEIGSFYGTVEIRPSGQANLYLDDGCYDLVTTSWVSLDGKPIYTEMGALNDVQVDDTTTTENESRLKIDVNNAPHIMLAADETIDSLVLIVTPQGINESTWWDESDITKVPTYFTPGSYQMLLRYDPLDNQGSFPEGDWRYDLLPATADAAGTVTLTTGQELTWGVGGAFDTRVDFGNQDTYQPGQVLAVTVATCDQHDNLLVGVDSWDEDIWYDRAQATATPRALQDGVPAPIERRAKVTLRFEHSGNGLVSRAVSRDGVQALSHNSPVFLIRRDADGEVLYRDASETYFKRADWTIPKGTPDGNYTAQYLVSVDGQKIFEQSQAFEVKNPVTPQPPTVPANLRSTVKSSTSISLAWDAATVADGIKEYVVRMKTGSGEYTEIGRTATTSFTKTGLAAATTYTFQVQAISNAGLASPWSSELSVTTDPASGGAPGGGSPGGGAPGGGGSPAGGGVGAPLPQPGPAGDTVSPAGGRVTAAGGQVTLDFAPGSFPVAVQIKTTQAPPVTTPPAGYRPVAPVFIFDTGGAEPVKPVLASFKYQTQLLGNRDPLQIGVYRQNGSEWEYMGGRLNRAGGTVEAWLTGFSSYTLLAREKRFNDTAGHWAARPISVLAAREIIGGYSDGSFQPEGSVTRAEMAKMLVTTLGQRWENPVVRVKTTRQTFSDVAAAAWYYNDVETAAAYGLFSGYEDGTFRPDAAITREEVTAILLRALGISPTVTDSTFQDAATISPWARAAVATASRRGLVSGLTATTFGPRETTTRAQAAALVYRVAEQAGILETVVTLSGQLTVNQIEGRHYELAVNGERYVLLADPTNTWLQESLAGAVDQTVTVRGILQTGADQFQRGPVVRVLDLK
ncbi:MAG: hypothetical protein PWQ18_449 [Clostridia bacterium]|nr:hypothetical protein [Clostridia bacterium]